MLVKDKDKSKWVLVYTKAKQEQRAKTNLDNQGLETFLPLIATTNNKKSSKVSLEVIFPRYIFTKIDIDSDNWRSINSTRGVSHFIFFGGKHAVVPNEFVNLVKSKTDEKQIFHPRIKENDFQEGEKLIIKKGAFAGFEGIFLSRNSKDRVRLLLRYLRQSVITEISISDIEEKSSIERFEV